ncbi:MAG TPA: ATP-binding protein [Paenibacillus sp.]|nr:ATP-binding protein [Paenibacillus sp.]
MFQKTKWNLITLNAAVFFVLFAALGLSAYAFIRHAVLESADEALLSRATVRVFAQPVAQGLRAAPTRATATLETVAPADATDTLYTFRVSQTDRTIYTVYWDELRQALTGVLPEEIDGALLEKLGERLDATSPFTVKSGGRTYRVMTGPGAVEPLVFGTADGTGSVSFSMRADSVQYITNITEEMDMLRRLLLLLAAGLAVAGLLAVTAGWYLASRALVPIRAAWERQQQFVADASHELRTPLAVVQAHAELLLRHPERTVEEESRSVTAVLKESRRMKKLVDGLLTLARTDSNAVELSKKALQVDAVLSHTVALVEELAACKGLIVRKEIEDGIACEADEERLHQLFLIVLDNAIKYTPAEGIVTVRCERRAHAAHIVVEDTGVGIPEKDVPHVFERFYRSDKVRSREEGGIGLGLAIAKWIVERHGGQIRIESRYGVGTAVHIALPL